MRYAGLQAVFLAAAALAASMQPAVAATRTQQAWCFEEDATDDQRIAGCTAVIQSSRTSAVDRGSALMNRGVAHTNKSDFDRAIADFSLAIRLNPAEAGVALSNRCAVRTTIGRLEEALADCNEAVRLTPDDPQARAVRGITYLKMGDYGRAIADFDTALAEVPDDALSLFGRGIAKRANGDEAGAAIDMAAARAIAADIEAYFVDCGVSI